MRERTCNAEPAFWESCWQRRTVEEYAAFLPSEQNADDPVIALFRRHGVCRVCDATCGLGASSLLLSRAEFAVEGFDIAPTAIEVARTLLGRCGVDASAYRTASVLDTGYADECFDAVIARSVLDHLPVHEAKAALDELFRIVRQGGLLVVSFDRADDEDFSTPHNVTADGSLLYCEGPRRGMIFHAYTDVELDRWFGAYTIVLSFVNVRRERFFALQK